MTVYVLESHPLMSKSIVMMLIRLSPKYKIIEVEKLSQLQAAILKNGAPTLFIVDPTISTLMGTVGLTNIKTLFPQAHLIAFSSIPAEDAKEACLQAGVDLYIEKTSSINFTLQKIKELLSPPNEAKLGEEIKNEDLNPINCKLTKRQIQLIALIDQGMSNDEIGECLKISSHTVKVHLWRLYKRFSVKSRTQLLSLARRHYLV